LGMDLTRTTDTGNDDALFKDFWQHNDAIVCCTWKGLPEFMFANRAGLEMFETTAGALQDLSWENTLDENSKKFPYTDFTQVLQQVRVFDPLDFQNQQMNHTFFEGWEFGIIYLCMCINRRGAKLSCRSLLWLYREKRTHKVDRHEARNFENPINPN
jgi:hypothetical protein